jgi:hypothetical protein
MDPQSPSSRSPEPTESTPPASQTATRKLLAIGDLHGDYFRLLRHLRENDLLLPDTLAWNPEADRVDLVLMGDYVDWRGEPLEDPLDQSPGDPEAGPRRILELIMHLEKELVDLRAAEEGFDSSLYALLGNHDEMMLEAVGVFDFLPVEQLQDLLARARNFAAIKRHLADHGLNSEQIERVMRFLNWYVQGGEATANGFGGLPAWKEAMEGDLGRFLRARLRLGVVVDHRLFAHTIPDQRKFWRPIEEIVALPDAEFRAARESFLWSRKIWGFDYYTGMRTSPFSEKEMEELLSRMMVRGAVVGHTPLSRGPDPVVAYGGRIVNLDVHGTPGSYALIEEYVPSEHGLRAPLRPPS